MRWIDSCLKTWLGVPRWLRAFAPLAIVLIQWSLSSQPPVSREPDVLRALLNNSMHVVVFGVLAASVWLTLVWPNPREDRLASLCAIVIAVVYGVVDEIHQSFVPGRAPSVADVLSDSFGGALAVSLIRRQFGLVVRHRAVLALAVLSAGSVAAATWGPA